MSQGRELSHSDCHSLAVFFALRLANSAPRGANDKILQAKLGALPFFQKPASEWQDLFTAFAKPMAVQNPYPKCACRCGCGDRNGASMCHGCFRVCCLSCHPSFLHGAPGEELYKRKNRDGYVSTSCHLCSETPQPKVKAPFTELPVNGLKWYFNFPCTETVPPSNNLDDPCRWCNPNRNVSMDPYLVDVVEVYKLRKLENASRHVRPLMWENAFELEIIVSDVRGGRVDVRVNLFCFMMNPKWNGHSIVKYLADWLPTHLEYIGPVLNMPLVYINVPAPKSPDSPVFAESTVRIEEVDDAEAAKSLAWEVQLAEQKAVFAAGPQEDEENDEDSMVNVKAMMDADNAEKDATIRRLEKRRRV
jgi:hypothetical protein